MPDKSHFICKNCSYYEMGFCKLHPNPTRKSAPSSDWCGQGKWLHWSERFKEFEPYYWGEWSKGTFDELPKQATPQEIYAKEPLAVKFREGN